MINTKLSPHCEFTLKDLKWPEINKFADPSSLDLRGHAERPYEAESTLQGHSILSLTELINR